MTKRNEQGQLTSDPIGSVAPENGLIDHIRDLDARIGRIEDNIWPNGDGSGTGRYREGTNWTQISDGTDYPGSYGVGPDKKPFVPFDELAVGDLVRVIDEHSNVDPDIHKIVGVGPDSVAVDDGKTYTRDHVAKVIPASEV